MSEWKKVELGETWDYKTAKEGDSVEGVFAGKDENVGENNSMIYRLETPEGDVRSIWGCTVLDTRMKNIKEGEEVKIVYKGTKPSPNRKGKNYHDFEVYHREPDRTGDMVEDLVKGID